MTISEQFRAARLAAGLTQTAAGALIGAKLRTVQAWEAGSRALSPAKLDYFFTKLGKTPT